MFNHDELLHCTASSCTTLSNLTGHLDYTPAIPWQHCSWSYRCPPPRWKHNGWPDIQYK